MTTPETNPALNDPDYVPINERQLHQNLGRLLLHSKTILEEYPKIDLTEKISHISDNLLEYTQMFNLTYDVKSAKEIKDWAPEHGKLFEDLYEEYQYSILENPPTTSWLTDPQNPIKLTFGKSRFAEERFANGIKPLKKNPAIWLSDLVDKAYKISEHYTISTKEDVDMIKQNTRQIKYYNYLMLYLYNIFFNNCTSKDRKVQLTSIIQHYEVLIGIRKSVPKASGGINIPGMSDGAGTGVGFIDGLIDLATPLIQSMAPEGEGDKMAETVSNVFRAEETKNFLTGVTDKLQNSVTEEGGFNLASALGSIAEDLNPESLGRIMDIAKQTSGTNKDSSDPS